MIQGDKKCLQFYLQTTTYNRIIGSHVASGQKRQTKREGTVRRIERKEADHTISCTGLDKWTWI